MPPKSASRSAARGTKRAIAPAKQPVKRARVARGAGTETQPFKLPETQQSQAETLDDQAVTPPNERPSPRKALADAASQATEEVPFEALLLRNAVPEDAIIPPVATSKAATVATINLESSEDEGFDERFVDNFDGINWARLPRYIKPTRTLKGRKSWVFKHGYRVASKLEPERTFFICKYCHQHKIMDATGEGVCEVTYATSSAMKHLGRNQQGHNITKAGKKQVVKLIGRQTSIITALKASVKVS